MFDIDFSAAITIRRAMLGMSRKDVAAAAGISYPYISELENGMKSPSWDVFVAVAKALRFKSLSAFVAFAEEQAALRAALLSE